MKAAIIGGGHNGLVCAAYLAKGGVEVTVYEKRQWLGGLCVTEELFPGYQVSSIASYYGMLRQEIVDELELTKYGLEPYITDPVEIVLLSNNRYVFTPRDAAQARVELGDVDEGELGGWQEFWKDLGAAAALLYPLYFEPDTTQADVVALLEKNGLDRVAMHIFEGSLLDLLAEYIDDEALMSVAATCTPGFANREGTVFGCIHHGTARTAGEPGAWGFVKGGMGQITQALVRSCQAKGVKIHAGKPVESIIVENGVAKGVKLEGGKPETFDLVIANADPFTVFQKLLPKGAVSDKILSEITQHEPKVSAGKVHFAMKQLPRWGTLNRIGHNYSGVIVSAPSIRTVIKDSENVPKGQMPGELMLTMGFPSVTDSTIVPEDKHLFTVDIHYLPAKLNGRDWTHGDSDMLIKQVTKQLEHHCPGFSQAVEASVAVTPGNLERKYNLRGASPWHLPMTPEYLFENRHMPGCKGYQTPVEGLLLCGASTYPGGNVSGAPGRNCAHEVLAGHGKSKSTGATTAKRAK